MAIFTGTQEFKMTVKTDNETGELGLMFNDCPIINYPMVANDGVLVAHDLLEHINGLTKIGSLDDELEALGAIWFIRGQHGQLRLDGIGSKFTPQENIASDVLNMARIYNNGVNFKTDAPVIDTDHEWYEEFKELVQLAVNDYDLEIDEDEQDIERLNFYTNSALAYMLAGYDKAVQRYSNMSDWSVRDLFFTIAKTVDKNIKNGFELLGQEFLLTVDFENLECNFEEFYDNEDIVVSIDFDGQHTDFTVYDNDTADVDEWLDENGLNRCNSDTEYTINHIDDALVNQSGYLVLPFDESRDITISFTY